MRTHELRELSDAELQKRIMDEEEGPGKLEVPAFVESTGEHFEDQGDQEGRCADENHSP